MVSSRNRSALRHGVTTVTRASRSDVAGIEAPCDADVGGAFNDGAAVGENHQVVGVDGDAQGEFVGADRRKFSKATRQIGQIERPVPFVNLYRVAAAQADRGAPGAVEMK